MGWELRNGRLYYYRKFRKGKRVISEYIGTVETAELIFALDEFDRIERLSSTVKWKTQKGTAVKLNKELNQLGRIVYSIARASLLLAGYYSHKGQWRQKRNG